jgi:lambda family phage portal protein
MNLFRRVLIKSARALEAAAGGRRWANARTIPNWNSAIEAAAHPSRLRARYQVANNAWLAKGVHSIVSNLIGAGIKPQSQHKSEEVRAELHRLWNTWIDFADVSGQVDFYGLQLLAGRAMVTDGEIFAWFKQSGPRGFCIQLISADQVDASINRDLGGGAKIMAGVEFDAAGARVAYHILPTPPGEGWPVALTPLRVPALDVVHLFEPIAPGQVRGISWTASILLRLYEIDQVEDAHLVRQKIAAMFAGIITDPDGSAAGIDGNQKGSVLEGGLEPGTLKTLQNGASIIFTDPPQVGDIMEFLKLQLRAVAAGLGLTYEQLTGDLSRVNYSSIRAGLIEFRRRIEAVQHSIFVFQFCRPVWQRFVLTEILTGRLTGRLEDLLPVQWIAPGFAWVDPLKDVQAELAAIAGGLMSRRQAVAGRGYDVESVDAELAADKARADRHGLTFTSTKIETPKEPDKDAD